MQQQFSVRRWTMRRLIAAMTICLLFSASLRGWAIDVFDRHGIDVLRQVVDSAAAQNEFTMQQATKLKPLASDIESTCLIVETNRGNLAKVLVSFGFRKQADKPPIQVIMLDRFVTYEKDKGESTVANGRNVMLFPGFQFDFDLGQVVPAGFDADVELTAKGTLKVLGSVRMFGVSGSQLPADEADASAKKQSEVSSPEDFSGIWQVDGDGRWIGEWDLSVNEQGMASGKFHSQETQASYPISGQMGGSPNQIKLQVEFNNATQIIEAYLWTKDKSKIAGSFSMSGRRFGLIAIRQNKK